MCDTKRPGFISRQLTDVRGRWLNARDQRTTAPRSPAAQSAWLTEKAQAGLVAVASSAAVAAVLALGPAAHAAAGSDAMSRRGLPERYIRIAGTHRCVTHATGTDALGSPILQLAGNRRGGHACLTGLDGTARLGIADRGRFTGRLLSFPSDAYGCAAGRCSRGWVPLPWPQLILQPLYATWRTRHHPAPGSRYATAVSSWLQAGANAPLQVVIVLNSRRAPGVPDRARHATAWTAPGGQRYWVAVAVHGTAHQVVFARARQVTAVRHLPLVPFYSAAFALAGGYQQASSLILVGFGDMLWAGGTGLGTVSLALASADLPPPPRPAAGHAVYAASRKAATG